MKLKRLGVLITTVLLITGCGSLDDAQDSLKDSTYEGTNVAPPVAIDSSNIFDIKVGDTINIVPNDVAIDKDGDELDFIAIGDSILSNSYLKIVIKNSYIECNMFKEALVGDAETIEVYVTDGTYRTKINISFRVVEEERESSSDNGIPVAKGNPVVIDAKGEETYIYPDDLATSKGELTIESISGNHVSEGEYGTLSYYNSSKALYTLGGDISFVSGNEETFVIVVTNGSNSLPVNVKIKIQ